MMETIAGNVGYISASAARSAPVQDLSAMGISPEIKIIYRLVVDGSGQIQSLVAADDLRNISYGVAGGTSAISAAAVLFAPTGSISSTNVQAALEELAAEFGTWVDSTITPAWTGGPPDITSAITRHVRNGNVVTFDMTYIISDGHDAILDSLTLPVTAAQVAGRQVPLTAFKMYTDGDGDSTLSDPFAYIDYAEATPVIKFRVSGGGYPADCSAILNISGSYEV
jgi:hypothetical protein